MHHVGGDEVAELVGVVWRQVGANVLVYVLRSTQLVLLG